MLRLSIACGDYDINHGLLNGEVTIQGVDATVITMASPERHWRLMRHGEFDITELSMASYLALFTGDECPYSAIPVFPHRRFRHSYLFVRQDAGINSPKDLEGRRVGLRTWQTTAGLWTRGILEDQYGVNLQSIDWVTQDDEDIPLDPDPPTGFRLRRVPQGDDVDRMLVGGDLEGLIYPELPPSFRKGDARMQRLFPNAKEEEKRYFAETGIFPIMHTVVIRKSLLEQSPWLAMNTVQAFRHSKDLAFKRMEDPRRVSLAWFRETLEEQRAMLGRDPWAYDFPSNREQIATVSRYAQRQGLTRRAVQPEELFDPASVDDPPQYVGA